jgi:hypothetical protein
MYYAGQTAPNVGHLYSNGRSGVNRAVFTNKLADMKNPSGRMKRNGNARPSPRLPSRLEEKRKVTRESWRRDVA